VARFAPRDWHSGRTVIDTSYEALEELARTPPRRSSTHAESRADQGGVRPLPGLLSEPPFALEAATKQDLEDAWVIHPWALAPAPPGRRAVGVFIAAFHRRWPWSEQRWRFVAKAMRQLSDRVLWCEVPLPLSIDTVDDPHVAAWLPAGQGRPVPRLYAEPGTRCRSFSAYWRRVGPDAAR
jgi:deoxyribodipyrimidine photo-lyase